MEVFIDWVIGFFGNYRVLAALLVCWAIYWRYRSKIKLKKIEIEQQNKLIKQHLEKPKAMKKALEDVGNYNLKDSKEVTNDSKQVNLSEVLKIVR